MKQKVYLNYLLSLVAIQKKVITTEIKAKVSFDLEIFLKIITYYIVEKCT